MGLRAGHRRTRKACPGQVRDGSPDECKRPGGGGASPRREGDRGLGGLWDPGLMTNDEVKALGQAPREEMLKKWLAEAICQNNNKEETDGQFKN